jgi:F-type H+-transporting ATPase subunit epsilon
VTLRVALVTPDQELWSGEARIVIAKTSEGDIGVLSGHAPVFGILAAGSVVEIHSPEEAVEQNVTLAAVSGGFLSVADDQVSVLATDAQLAGSVDVAQARRDEEAAEQAQVPGEEESADLKYARALRRVAGDQA